jgi:hypothetical protein
MVFVIRGQLSIAELIAKAVNLARHFFDPPRQRKKQATQAVLAAQQLKGLS